MKWHKQLIGNFQRDHTHYLYKKKWKKEKRHSWVLPAIQKFCNYLSFLEGRIQHNKVDQRLHDQPRSTCCGPLHNSVVTPWGHMEPTPSADKTSCQADPGSTSVHVEALSIIVAGLNTQIKGI